MCLLDTLSAMLVQPGSYNQGAFRYLFGYTGWSLEVAFSCMCFTEMSHAGRYLTAPPRTRICLGAQAHEGTLRTPPSPPVVIGA